MGTWTPSLHQKWHCSVSGCVCEGFLPGRRLFRSCERCSHGWLPHALSEDCVSSQLEPVECQSVCSLGSLILLGSHSLPVRLRILLDRLFSVLTHSQVISILQTLGWTLRDYARGYKMQDSTGNILDRWNSVTPEEEQMILRQFLRYGETRSIVEIMMEEADSERSFTTDFISPGASLKQTQALQQPALHMSEEHEPSYTSPLEQQPSTTKQQRLRDVNLGSQNPEPRFQTAPGTRMPQSATKKCEQEEVQILPDGEKKPQNWSSSSSNKCRVKCDACEKTFYDKGTLKIHFNAVHLKIKHRCTIDGCEMMFSSLRSRNRHSANPNPRLHAALERTARPFISRPAFHRENSVSIATSDFMTVKQSEISRGGAKGCVTNQIEVTQVMAKKKKSRKSSTPLKIKQNHQTMLPRQPVNALHGNQPQIRFTNQLCDHKQLQKMLYGCHDISYNDKKGMNDKWTAIWQPMAGVKEET